MSAIGDFFKPVVRHLTGLADKSAGAGTKAFGRFLYGGTKDLVGGTVKSLWGSNAESLGRGVLGPTRGAIPGVLREMLPSIRNRTLGALPKFGMASLVDNYLETPDADSLTGAQRFGLNAVSFGLKFGAYRSLARGVAGTVLSGAGRINGDPLNYFHQYRSVAKALGPMWKSGSLTGKALKGAAYGARELAYTPFRAVIGLPGTLSAAGRAFARFAGDVGSTAGTIGGGLVGSATGPMGFMAGAAIGSQMGRLNRFGGGSLAGVLHPKIPGKVGRALAKVGLINKELDAPVMSTMIGLGAGMQYFRSKSEYNQSQAGWVGTGPKYNPLNYGGGIQAMRRGQAQNYGPALTLMLHAGQRRVMP